MSQLRRGKGFRSLFLRRLWFSPFARLIIDATCNLDFSDPNLPVIAEVSSTCLIRNNL